MVLFRQLVDVTADPRDERLERDDRFGEATPDVEPYGLVLRGVGSDRSFVEAGPAERDASAEDGCWLLAFGAVHGSNTFTLRAGKSLPRGCELFTAWRNNGRVRHVCVLLVAIVTACSSSDAFEKHLIEGGPGQAITVDITGVDSSLTVRDPDRSRRYTLQIEVGNSTDALLTVTQISVNTDGNRAFQVYPTVNRFNELIDPGKDHVFEMNLRGGFVRAYGPQEAHTVVLRVIVTLSNGDAYAYSFEGPVEDDRTP